MTQPPKMPALLVFPHAATVAWDGTEAGARNPDLGKYPYQAMPAALVDRYGQDAHAVGYLVPTQTSAPRLNVSSIGTLMDMGDEPLMVYVFLDVDNPGHGRWDVEAAELHCQSLLHEFGGPGQALHHAGIYTTRGGYRLVFRPRKPIPVSKARSWLHQFVGHYRRDKAGAKVWVDGWITKQTGIRPIFQGDKWVGGLDPASNQWSRMYRLPKVRRERQDTDTWMDLDGLSRGPLTWWPTGNLETHVGPSAATDSHWTTADCPDDPAPLGDGQWELLRGAPVAARYMDKLQAGKKLGSRGNRDNTMMAVLASIAGHLGTTDPILLYRYMWRSIDADESDGSPSIGKLWDRCIYVADLEAKKAKMAEKVSETPPVVYAGSAYYVLDVGGETYRPPVPGPALCQALEQWTGPLGLQTRSRTGKPRPTNEYLAEYGRQAVHVIAEMGRERTVFLEGLNGGTLLEGCCVVRQDITPTEHPEVQKWLELLGGGAVDSLLDWVATVTQLDKPSCALYLRGEGGSGKGMLAAGLAALWGTGATSYHDLSGNWNDALARCPLIFADESMRTQAGTNFSADFRSLIAESERPLRRRFQNTATIRGCIRLIIAANNDQALNLDEDLTQEDIRAIVSRVLYVQASDKAAEYLAHIGGRTATERWVHAGPGKAGFIAEHALWLAKARQVIPGKRFLVEGRMERFHMALSRRSGFNTHVLAALALYTTQDRPGGGFMFDDQGLWVNAPSLRKLWGSLTNTNPPTDSTVAKALQSLALDRKRIRLEGRGRIWMSLIPRAAIEETAMELQIGDPDRIAARFTTNPQGPTNQRGQVLNMLSGGQNDG